MEKRLFRVMDLEVVMDRSYRVIKKTVSPGKTVYQIYQVYFDEHGGVRLVSAEPASPARECLAGLKGDLERMRCALELPVLDEDRVLDALELSYAGAYGRWVREQIFDGPGGAGEPEEIVISPREELLQRQKRLEEAAAVFAEKVRKNPAFGQE